MKKIHFIKESLKSLQEVGTVLPSSKSVVNKMVEPINFNEDIIIIELGSGTGVITKEIIQSALSLDNKKIIGPDISFDSPNLFNIVESLRLFKNS